MEVRLHHNKPVFARVLCQPSVRIKEGTSPLAWRKLHEVPACPEQAEVKLPPRRICQQLYQLLEGPHRNETT